MIVGSWNPAIINPSWLQKLAPDIFTSKNFEGEILAGASNVFRFKMDGILIEPTAARLTLYVRSEDEGIWEKIETLAIKLVQTLPHTPLQAIGLNFMVKLDPAQRPLYEAFLAKEEMKEKYAALGMHPLQSVTVVQRFQVPSGHLEVQFRNGGRKVLLNFNYPATNFSQAENALRKIGSHRAEALNLVSQLLYTPANHDVPHPTT